MKIKINRLSQTAKVPTYATPGSACFDLYAAHNALVYENDAKTVDTGLAFEIPKDHVMLVFSRSGHGFKNSVRLRNCVGVIDSDFRGSVKVGLRNDGNNIFPVSKGERIAQALVLPVEKISFEEVNNLSDTERGQNGIGSTGK